MAKLEKPPLRFCIGVMIFFSAATNYMIRANMSVSVGEMAKPIVVERNVTCNKEQKKDVTEKPKDVTDAQFKWNQNDQAQIIAAYFYGTMLTFFFGGTLAELLGAVNIIFWTSVLTAILTAFTPLIATAGDFEGTFSVRFFLGVLGGPIYPAMNVLVAHWAPPKERGRFLSALIGNTVGVMVTWLLVGFVTDRWGWPVGFYSVAVLMVVFCIIFCIVTTDSPQKHRWISQEEKDYIIFSQGGTVSLKKRKKAPPYCQIAKSMPFWATVVAQFGNLWGLNLMLTFAPKYFKETLGFNLKSAVGYAVIPYIARLFSSQLFGVVGDLMRKHDVMSLKGIRRLFMVVSHIIPAICFCFIYLAECNWQAVLALLVINQALTGAVVVGHLVNLQDLSPNFAGTLYGIMNWLASTTGFFVPSINGTIFNAYNEDPVLAAAIIYVIGGAVMIATGIFFIVFLSAEVQPWNAIEESEENEAS